MFDLFLGSGTTFVVAKKLGRRYIGVEWDGLYCCWAEKRLAIAETNASIQGYADDVFWERNTLHKQVRCHERQTAPDSLPIQDIAPDNANEVSA